MNWYKISQSGRFSHRIPLVLRGLAAEARKCKNIGEFWRDFSSRIKHGTYWHVTDDPNFKIDPTRGPRDMSSLSIPTMSPGKLMITSNLRDWTGYMNRKYAVQIDMSEVPRNAYWQVNRGFGNEFWVEDPSKAKVIRIVPIKQSLKLNSYAYKQLPHNEQELVNFYNISTGQNNTLEDLQKSYSDRDLGTTPKTDKPETIQETLKEDLSRFEPDKKLLYDAQTKATGATIHKVRNVLQTYLGGLENAKYFYLKEN